jgi:8-oxo-dGTP pyrophosphatase MutT (NUDIX family)
VLEPLPAGDERLRSSNDLAVARAALLGYPAPDAAQQQVRDEIVAFVDVHPDAADRTCVEGHLTGSALVVDASNERVLLLFHRKAQRWLQPGGHADGDTNLAAVALREATEETGIADLRIVLPPVDLDIHRVHFAGEHAHLHLDVRYLVLAPAGAVEAGNDESEALRWVTLAELDQLEGVDAGTIRMARRGLDFVRSG